MPFPPNGVIADFLTEALPNGRDIVFNTLLSIDADLVDTLWTEDEN